jgi:hypothetical protein
MESGTGQRFGCIFAQSWDMASSRLPKAFNATQKSSPARVDRWSISPPPHLRYVDSLDEFAERVAKMIRLSIKRYRRGFDHLNGDRSRVDRSTGDAGRFTGCIIIDLEIGLGRRERPGYDVSMTGEKRPLVARMNKVVPGSRPTWST